MRRMKGFFQGAGLILKYFWWRKIRRKSKMQVAQNLVNDPIVLKKAQEAQDQLVASNVASSRYGRNKLQEMMRQKKTNPEAAAENLLELMTQTARVKKQGAQQRKKRNKKKKKNTGRKK